MTPSPDNRSGRRQRRARRATVAAAIAVLAVVGLVGCGIRTDGDARAVSDADVPFGLLDDGDGTSTTVASPATEPVNLCMLRADGTLASVPRDLPGDSPLADVVAALGEPPDESEQAVGFTTAIAEDAEVNEVTTAAGVADVDLGTGVIEGSARAQLEAVAQIVCTLTQQPGIGQVRFLVDGVTVEVARGDGSTTAEPVSRSDYATLIAP